MTIKEVLEFNVKAMRDGLNSEILSGNVAKQEFYKGAIYTLSALLAHPVLTESPVTPSNSAMVPCKNHKNVGGTNYCSINEWRCPDKPCLITRHQ